MVENGNRIIIEQDVLGNYHFNGNFNNANSLKQALDSLGESYQDLIQQEEQLLLEIFEEIFNHKAFTGRSGTFFGYEGLGSIYWHMVSKLLLAVQENCLLAINTNASDVVIGKLLDHYYEINAGIGVHKSPELYGAIPTDPYSHTPATKGAQQPGMTGQVKEDVLSRFGELGVFVKEGCLSFKPSLLKRSEFLNSAKQFTYTSVSKGVETLEIQENEMSYTYCQIPVIYRLSDVQNIKVVYNDNNIIEFDTYGLDKKTSSQVFKRTGEINKIIVSVVN